MAAPQPTPEEMYWYVANFTAPAYGICVWAGALLCGICVMQCYNYLRTVKDDPLYLRIMAIFITFLQVACAVFEVIGHNVQDRYMAARTIAPGMFIPWTDAWIILVSCASGMCAQAFYGKLIWRMTQTSSTTRRWSWLWVATFTTLWLAVAGMGVTAFVFFVEVPTKYWVPELDFVNLVGLPVNFYTAWLVAAAALDLTLSSILVGRFVKDIRRDGFAETNSILTSLALSTLETFALTATLALVDMICAILVSHTSTLVSVKLEIVCYFLTVLIARAYCSSFLYTLQRHATVRQMRQNKHSTSGHKQSASAYYNQSPITSTNAHGARVIRLAPAMRMPSSEEEAGITSAGIVVETEKEQKVERADDIDQYVLPIVNRRPANPPRHAPHSSMSSSGSSSK